MKPLRKNRNHAIIPLSIIVSLIMVYLTVINYLDYSDTLISNEQRRLLAVADAIARSIEENVGSNSVYLNIVVGDTSFVKTMDALHGQSSDNIDQTQSSEMEQILRRFMKVNNAGIIELTIFSPKFELLSQHPIDNPFQLTPEETDEMKAVVESRLPKVGDTYFPDEGSPYYTIYMPVFSGSEFLGVLRGKISTDYIYDKLIKPVELGIVGYASVKTNETRLLMHPSSGDIGQELMKVRRARFPQYDWSELERVASEQLVNRRGVSIYHSIWAGDASGQRVKKFSAYSSADIGDNFWIVTISADYKQVMEVIHKNYYITLITSAMIFIAVIFALINFLVTRQRQIQLEESIHHNKALEKLNVELAEDIRQREILQKELTKMLNKYSAIFANTKDCIFIVDFSDKHVGHLIEQNVKALEVFGYPDEDISTLTLEQLDLDHDKEDLEERFGSLDIGNSTLYETVLAGRKGVKVPVEAQCSVFELDGKRRLLYIARDISQRKQEEQILIRSERRFMSIVNELATRMKDE
ncbi:MAG: PAS domain S-box protein, partial [Clostridia bacterium]|nr:PAS domain S-box protein [Clostridia bacterium]